MLIRPYYYATCQACTSSEYFDQRSLLSPFHFHPIQKRTQHSISSKIFSFRNPYEKKKKKLRSFSLVLVSSLGFKTTTHIKSYYIITYYILLTSAYTRQVTMYPKVKVRIEDQGEKHAMYEHKWNSLLSLKDVQFLSTQDSCFPVKENLDVSPQSAVKIPKSYVPSVALPAPSASEVTDKKSNFGEEDRPHIRVGSIPRPRAVLSSPDNDAVIGNKNRIKQLRPSALNNQNSVPSIRTQCKVIPHLTTDDSLISTRKFKEGSDDKGDLKGKNRPALVISSRRRQ